MIIIAIVNIQIQKYIPIGKPSMEKKQSKLESFQLTLVITMAKLRMAHALRTQAAWATRSPWSILHIPSSSNRVHNENQFTGTKVGEKQCMETEERTSWGWAGPHSRKNNKYLNLGWVGFGFGFGLGLGWGWVRVQKQIQNPFPGRSVGRTVYTDYNTLYGLPLGNPFRPIVAIYSKKI